jgi:cellulose synthase/poly-beta-1,6-N-acetylglucosamine synthase-like glycosyltransferase
MVDYLLNAAALVYLLAVVFLGIFSMGLGVLLVIYALKRRQHPSLPIIADHDLPTVTVQLPIYNEADVIARLIDACAVFDYPADKFHIQVLDDSTDHTHKVAAARVRHWRERGVNIAHIRRPDRAGYKAGALNYGTALAKTDFTAVFDADFVPPPDFLRRTTPHFVGNERLALIQTRWGHLNADYNALTRAQMLGVDAHFVVEQTARSRGGLIMSMNGSAGLWRKQAILDAGGWSSATLCEDFDLSLRAAMRGWRSLYLSNVVVPGELPPQVQAFKVQQARWATGSTQCLVRHCLPLWRSPHLNLAQKVMGTIHMLQYMVQLVILISFLLMPVLIAGNRLRALPDLSLFSLIGVLPLMVTAIGQMTLYPDGAQRFVMNMPARFILSIALLPSNSRAVLSGLLRRREHEFKRTPKYRVNQRGEAWTHSLYALPADAMTYGESLLAVYAVGGMIIAMQHAPNLMPYMLSYAFSFAVVALWNWLQTHNIRRAR